MDLKAPDNSINETIKILEEEKIGKKKLIIDSKIGEFLDKDIGVVQFQSFMMKKENHIKFQNQCYL